MFIFNLFLAASLSQLWGLLNSQQMTVFLPMFKGLKFPANAMMVIEFMIQLATFDLVPTSFVDEEMYYWPESDPFSTNFEMAGTETVFLLANIGFAIYMIYYHILLALVHACLHMLRNCSRVINKLHTKISGYLYWDGI